MYNACIIKQKLKLLAALQILYITILSITYVQLLRHIANHNLSPAPQVQHKLWRQPLSHKHSCVPHMGSGNARGKLQAGEDIQCKSRWRQAGLQRHIPYYPCIPGDFSITSAHCLDPDRTESSMGYTHLIEKCKKGWNLKIKTCPWTHSAHRQTYLCQMIDRGITILCREVHNANVCLVICAFGV